MCVQVSDHPSRPVHTPTMRSPYIGSGLSVPKVPSSTFWLEAIVKLQAAIPFLKCHELKFLANSFFPSLGMGYVGVHTNVSHSEEC